VLPSQNIFAADVATEKKIAALKVISTVANAKLVAAEKNLKADNEKLEQLKLQKHESKLANKKAEAFLKSADKQQQDIQKEIVKLTADHKKVAQAATGAEKNSQTAITAAKAAAAALQKAKVTVTTAQTKLKTAQQVLKTAQASEKAAKKAFKVAKTDPEKKKITESLAKLAATIKAQQNSVKQITQQLATAKKRLPQVDAKVKATAKLVTTKAAIVKTSAAKLAEALKKLQTVQQSLKDHQAEMARSKAVVAGTPAAMKKIDLEILAQEKRVTSIEATVAPIRKDATSKLLAYEEILLANGKIVSFSDAVAPIFMRKCVVCHSDKIAKGRLNMQTYAGLM